MIKYADSINYYKKREIQKALLEACTDKEVGMRFELSDISTAKGYMIRSEVLTTPFEIFEFAKKGASSFHVSEERWTNAREFAKPLTQKQINELRKGWDLIIDVDFKIWEATKLIVDAIIRLLRNEGIENIGCKFSGNKGFHISVPYESFPDQVSYADKDGIKTEKTKDMYPEATRRIVKYIIDKIDDKEKNFPLSKKIISLPEFISYINKDVEHQGMIKNVCTKCGKEKNKETIVEFYCLNCGHKERTEKNIDYMLCPKCKRVMKKTIVQKADRCECGNDRFTQKLNLEIDTILVSPRHLYRAPYSLHEKSGLASIPIDPKRVMEFDKSEAIPEKVTPNLKFIEPEKSKKNEAERLFISAYDHFAKSNENKMIISKMKNAKNPTNYEDLQADSPIPKEYFPPSIKKGLEGLKDGRKRFLFILLNFLDNAGYNLEMIKKEVNEWNDKNSEPLRENYISGQLNFFKKRKNKILPPNYENQAYYKDLGILSSEEAASRIKNPIFYVRKATALMKNKEKKKTVKKKPAKQKQEKTKQNSIQKKHTKLKNTAEIKNTKKKEE